MFPFALLSIMNEGRVIIEQSTERKVSVKLFQSVFPLCDSGYALCARRGQLGDVTDILLFKWG